MKIIMNNVVDCQDAMDSFTCVQWAIRDGIKQGRHNWRGYDIRTRYISVCRNKNSFTVYL